MCRHACVNLDNVIWMLTALAAVVVPLTRMRLSAVDQQAGHAQIPQATVNAHTITGVVALAVWVYYLTSPDDLPGRRKTAGPRVRRSRSWGTSVCCSASCSSPTASSPARSRDPRKGFEKSSSGSDRNEDPCRSVIAQRDP